MQCGSLLRSHPPAQTGQVRVVRAALSPGPTFSASKVVASSRATGLWGVITPSRGPFQWALPEGVFLWPCSCLSPPNLRILPLTFPATWGRRRHLLPSAVCGGGPGSPEPPLVCSVVLVEGCAPANHDRWLYLSWDELLCFKKPPGTGLWGGGWGGWRQELSSREQLPRPAGPDHAQPSLAWVLLPIGWMNIILPLVPGQG